MLKSYILSEIRGQVGMIKFNRPDALNALNPQLLIELLDELSSFDTDSAIGAMLLTGSEKVFAAGADIKFMANAVSSEMRENGFVELFEGIRKIKKPVIAAVSGFALGGGCELALACDIVVASETARFGQPEITLGVIPGGGGTQRLARALGKNIAMEMVLNNRTLSAREALQYGLVNRVVPVELYLQEGLSLAEEIASRAPLALMAAKKSVNNAFESSLTIGLQAERELFYELFDSTDQKEGMQAFISKRKPVWIGK
ncbi:MAG: enoyl-CoA hydratase-related protein [Chloroflexota bacterium]